MLYTTVASAIHQVGLHGEGARQSLKPHTTAASAIFNLIKGHLVKGYLMKGYFVKGYLMKGYLMKGRVMKGHAKILSDTRQPHTQMCIKRVTD